MTQHELLEQYIDILLQSDCHSLVIKGSAGVGKTQTILDTIKKKGLREGVNYYYITGFTTPLELYNILKQSTSLQPPKLYIFDDLEGVVSSKVCLGLLKSALWEARGKRIVNYQSTTSKLEDGEKSFEFQGKIVLVVNNLREENAFGKSLLDRGIYFNMRLSPKELTAHIEGILDKLEDSIPLAEKKKIWNEIKKFSGNQKFTIRSVNRAFQFYKHAPNNWLPLFTESMNLTVNERVFYRLKDEPIKEKDKEKKFTELTGKTPRTYRNVKSKITTRIT